MSKQQWLVVVFICLLAALPAGASPQAGALLIVRNGQPAGFCPLRHTDVKAGISGFIARVLITQDFQNPSPDKIEAVYTFPLPQNAALDDMTIQAGGRTIRGQIKRREDAAAIYNRAIQRGQMAALLDQERPNIFTQTVGNVPPGESVRVTISYLVQLKYADGSYELVFPMVVGPRYIPGNVAVGHQGGGWAPDTNQVRDASRITPPVAFPGTRAGHDISLAVVLDAGVPIQDLRSPTHQIDVNRTGADSAIVLLRNAAEIPNKDFILRYSVAGATVVEGLLTHATPAPPRVIPVAMGMRPAQTQGYFSLIIQPPRRFPESDVTPKELIFVLDSSGSMNGFPEEKSKELINYAIDGLYPGDTFNVIKFSGDTAVLFDKPVYPSAENLRLAKEFVNNNWGGGGTEMMGAIRAALAPSGSPDHLRIVVFLTDGEVGNDMEILGEIRKHPNARVFAYGIGSSVNRFLLDKMAEEGRGEVDYVSYKPDSQEAGEAAHRLYEHLRAPLLTDIALDFGRLPVTDVYPRHIRDLYSGRPVVVTGRYTAPAQGVVRLVGRRAGDFYSREIHVSFPAQENQNNAIASLWARDRIDDLMSQDWAGVQQGTLRADLRQQITQLGLDYHLMTQFTSFVAVEDRVVTDGGKPKRIQVPVEMAEGVQYEPIWSGNMPPGMALRQQDTCLAPMTPTFLGGAATPGAMLSSKIPALSAGSGGGVGSGHGTSIGPGNGGGIGGGIYRVGGGVSAPTPLYSPAPKCPQAACQGMVDVWALVGRDGKVRDAKVARSAGGGMDAAALSAVRQWKFLPAMKDGQPVPSQMNIQVAFNGTSASTSNTSNAENTGKPPRIIELKLHPQLVAAYDCWRAQADKRQAGRICKLKADKLRVNVIVSGDAEALLPQLKAIGFEPERKPVHAHQIAGRVSVGKLDALAGIARVVFVAPEAATVADVAAVKR
jgi:Ca-activated chloride channel family protein